MLTDNKLLEYEHDDLDYIGTSLEEVESLQKEGKVRIGLSFR